METFTSTVELAQKSFKAGIAARMTTTEGKVLVSTLDTTIDNILYKSEQIIQGIQA